MLFRSRVLFRSYQKLPEGPAPRQLLPARQALLAEHAVKLEYRQVFNYIQQRIVPLRDARPVFTPQELAIVDDMIRLLSGMTGRDVTLMSHDEAGWKAVDYLETIPYRTAWLSSESSSEAHDIALRVLDPELVG